MERVWCWSAEEGDRGSEGRSCGGDEEDNEVAAGGRSAPMNESSSHADLKAAFSVAEREAGQS